MTFKVKQGNMENGMSLIYESAEFEELQDACEMFFNLKRGQWAIEEDMNHLFLISPDDEIIEQHSSTKENN